jgi:hypothetical protein
VHAWRAPGLGVQSALQKRKKKKKNAKWSLPLRENRMCSRGDKFYLVFYLAVLEFELRASLC